MSQVPLHVLSDRLRVLVDEERDYQAAFALGRHLLRYWPKHVATYARLAGAALAAGLTADAVDLYQRCLSADPENADLWGGYARAAADLGLKAEAEMAAQYAVDLIDETGATLPAQAHLALRRGDPITARDRYVRAMADHPGRMDLLLGLATVLMELGEEAYSERVARQVLVWLPNSLKAHHLLLMLAARHGEADVPHPSRRVLFALDPDGDYARRRFGWLPLFAAPATLPDFVFRPSAPVPGRDRPV
ncbi:MAG: tetratricopeptide repeat protein [Caldilineales bacterium]|nr:tetratricopeptide repeat protein [Caldilineales bacterium]